MAVIQGILASDDQEVEAWYLEGWCFNLMASHSRETGEKVEGLGWDELSRDALDCLEACQTVRRSCLPSTGTLTDLANSLRSFIQAKSIPMIRFYNTSRS